MAKNDGSHQGPKPTGAALGGRMEFTDDAPEVKHDLLVVENKGLQIVSDPCHGRVVIATKDFVGSDYLEHATLLKELPALICQQDYMDFLETFLDKPQSIQVGILDMYYQPLDSAMGESLVEPAKLLYMLQVLPDFTIIHQLLSIFVTNSHQYKEDKAAMFFYGSKFSHSCNPNIGYSSSSSDGCLRYVCIRPIRKGEQVAFSYLTDIFETPTMERRQLLLETKSFWCTCERCLGPDYCRFIQCPTCPLKVVCQYNPSTAEASWTCPKCAVLETSVILRTERDFTQALHLINTAIEKRKDFNTTKPNGTYYTPSMIQDLVEECWRDLSLTHHLTIKALRLLVMLSTSLAYVEIKKLIVRGLSTNNSRVHHLLRTSVISGFQLVLAGECVAAGCPGCYIDIPRSSGDSNDEEEDGEIGDGDYSDSDHNSDQNTGGGGKRQHFVQIAHEPHYDRALQIRYMCDNLLQLPFHFWPPESVAMVTRYLPLLKIKFQWDEDMEVIERRLVRDVWSTLMCQECGNIFPSYESQDANYST